jgi:hypothetical protein
MLQSLLMFSLLCYLDENKLWLPHMPKNGLSKGTSRYALKPKEEKLHLKFKKL